MVRYEDYRRALCFLDPYGVHLDWRVIERAGAMRSLEIFLNFPIMDMNRNAIWRCPDGVSAEGLSRMAAFWGDDSWRSVMYRPEPTLFGEDQMKQENQVLVESFRQRPINKAGFAYVAEPIPMRNSRNAVIYYLFFAGQNATGCKIARSILSKYAGRRS